MIGKLGKWPFIFVVVLFFGYSCKTLKIRTETDRDYTIEGISENYIANLGKFQSLSVHRMNVALFNNSNETSLRGSLRLVRDSAILVSLNAGLGIELARAFLTQENIQIIDRINSEYSIMNYSQIINMIGIDADYKVIEKLLLNSFLFSDLLSLKEYSISHDNEYVIVYDKQNVLISGFDEARIFFRRSDFIVKKIDLFNNQNKHFASIEYSDFSTFEKGIIVPIELRIFVNRGGETVELIIGYLKSEINTVKGLTFAVPSRYL